jgi:hypothetical protein
MYTKQGPREMAAKYAGKCTQCAERIDVGDTILYDGRARHKNCPDAIAALQPVLDAFTEGLLAEGPEFLSVLNEATLYMCEARLLRKLPRAARHVEAPKAQADDELSLPTAPQAIEDGYYTVEFSSGEYRTFRVHTNSSEGSPFFGKRVVSFLSGPDNGSDYTGCAFVGDDAKVHIWKRFREDTRLAEALKVLEDPTQAAELGLAYALKSNNCWKCGRTLTVPASITRGLGPICADKF